MFFMHHLYMPLDYWKTVWLDYISFSVQLSKNFWEIKLINLHTFKFKADFWAWCSLLPKKMTHGLYQKIPFWENLITETANSSRLIFQLFSQNYSYGNPLISSIFKINFYQQSTLLIIFTLLLCRISWHLVLCRPFHVHTTINPAVCQKKEAVTLLKWFCPTYMQLYSE